MTRRLFSSLPVTALAASASTSVTEMQPTITVSINVKASFQPDAAWITDQLVARLRELVIQALKETDNNQVHAAKLLGITRATLRKRIEKFGIQREMKIE